MPTYAYTHIDMEEKKYKGKKDLNLFLRKVLGVYFPKIIKISLCRTFFHTRRLPYNAGFEFLSHIYPCV